VEFVSASFSGVGIRPDEREKLPIFIISEGVAGIKSGLTLEDVVEEDVFATFERVEWRPALGSKLPLTGKLNLRTAA
jgi:hypothetical protein